jgi:hypothetical protein
MVFAFRSPEHRRLGTRVLRIMVRRVRRLALVVALLVLAGVLLLAFVERPALQQDRNRTDVAWRPLRPPLAQRYSQLRVALTTLKTAGIGDRKIATDLDAMLQRWESLHHTVDADADTESEVTTANSLEGDVLRLHSTINASARLKANTDVVNAIHTVDVTTPDPKLVDAYNAAATKYQKSREGLLRRYAASLFDFAPRPSFELASSG